MELTEITVFTDDVGAKRTFYEVLLGREPESEAAGIAMFDAGGVELLVHESYEADAEELPPQDHFAFAVEDVDAAFTKCVENGLTGYREPTDYEWGRSAYLRDPDGRLVELTEQ